MSVYEWSEWKWTEILLLLLLTTNWGLSPQYLEGKGEAEGDSAGNQTTGGAWDQPSQHPGWWLHPQGLTSPR